MATSFFNDLQHGTVNRALLSPDYAAFLTPQRIRQAATTLAPLGEVIRAQLLGISERGGTQVARVQLTAGSRTVNTLMYRRPDGVLEEFLMW